MKKIGLGILIIVGCLVLAVIVYGYVGDYNIVKVLMVELTPNYSFSQIVKGFNTSETEHIIWYYPAEAQPLDEDMEKMEKAYTDACKFWDVDPVKKLGGKIRFVWLPGQSRYDRSKIQKALGEKTQGRSIPSEGIIYSIFSYTPHELNHAIAGIINNTTTLLNEGFANYLNKINWDSNVYQRMVKAKKNGKIIPLEDMLTNKSFRSQDSYFSYAEAALFVKYLVEERDPKKFKRLYKEVNFYDKKEQVIKKIENIYNQSFDKFVAEWEDYLNKVL